MLPYARPPYYNYVYFNIDGRSKALTLSVYDKERFKYNLNSIGLDQTDTVRFYRDDAKSYYKFYKFVPETNGTYNLKMNVTPHDDNCRISTYYNVYHNGELVSTNYNVEVHAYVKNGKYCVVNNTYEPQDTTVYIGDGSSFDLHLNSNEIKWYEI